MNDYGALLVPIGRFAKLTRLSVKALRLYDQLGLLRPARVDRASGYRYYTLAQLPLAERVHLLRSLDVPLDEIRALLAGGDAEAYAARLRPHRERIERRIAEDARILATLDRLAAPAEPAEPEATLRALPAQPVVAVALRCGLAEVRGGYESAFDLLAAHAAAHGARVTGAGFSLIHGADWLGDALEFEALLPVERAVAAGGRVTSRELPAVTAARAMHAGSYYEIGRAAQRLRAWIAAQGRRAAGSLRAVFHVSSDDTPVPDGYRTELFWPVE